jgi:hypothetical protein
MLADDYNLSFHVPFHCLSLLFYAKRELLPVISCVASSSRFTRVMIGDSYHHSFDVPFYCPLVER